MKKNSTDWLLFIAISIIWGSSFILMKEGLKALNAFEVASIRMISGGLLLSPFAIKAFRMVPRGKWPVLILAGMIGTFIPAYLFCIAETRIDSSLAGILNALSPLFTLLIGALFFSNPVPVRKWMGVIIGFAGLVLLMLAGEKEIKTDYIGYASAVVLATVCYGLNVNIVNHYLRQTGSMHIASIAFVFLILPGLFVLIATGFFQRNLSDPAHLHSVLASALLGFGGTALASWLFFILLKRSGPVFSSMVTYGIPFVAVGWGLLAGEQINLLQVFCLLLILAGVYLANKSNVKRET